MSVLPARVAVPWTTLGLVRGRLLVERNLVLYRRSWPILVSGFLEPVLYLFSIGVGIGSLVRTVSVGGTEVSYLAFVAPAMLAASAMNGAIFDATFNVFFKLKYAKLYDAVLATPLGPRDVAVGEITWALLRGTLYAAGFLTVMAVLGLVRSWWALAALPAALLVGFAFAAAGMAATTYLRSWQDFEWVLLATMPMFLFSGTFYPLQTYPAGLQHLVAATPLYQGVALLRGLLLGPVGPGLLGHAAYLTVLGLCGVALTARRLRRLLLP